MTNAKTIKVQHINKMGVASQTTKRKRSPFEEVGKVI
jgi:hypothetical protein